MVAGRGRVERPVDGGGPGLGDLLSMGVTLATCVAAGFGLGWLVDLWLDTFPAFALVGLGFGVVAAVLYVARMFRTYL
jgi:F0F1-type ATP synthase assembly protein I